MEFRVTQEEKELREKIRRIAVDYIKPRAKEIDETDDVTWDVIEKLAEEGIFRTVVPKAYGGIAENVMATNVCIVREELSRVSSNADAFFAMQGLACYPLILAGTEEQKKKILPAYCGEKFVAGFAFTTFIIHVGKIVCCISIGAIGGKSPFDGFPGTLKLPDF